MAPLFMKARTMDARKATHHLQRVDPILARAIVEIGPFRLRLVPGRFGALLRSILHQQLALKAAQTITTRFCRLYGNPRGRLPTAAELLRTPPRRLRATGISRQKTRYLKDLARKVDRGALSLGRLGRMNDEEVIGALTQVKGIGRWTAEMFLIFSLGRPDVWAVDDLGLRLAVKRLYHLRRLPSANKMRRIAEPWRPYRSVASWYLWQSRRKALGVTPDSPV
jgi:DNA-3-methyladenine glycosylase II